MVRRAAGRNSGKHYILGVVFGERAALSRSWSLLGQSETDKGTTNLNAVLHSAPDFRAEVVELLHIGRYEKAKVVA